MLNVCLRLGEQEVVQFVVSKQALTEEVSHMSDLFWQEQASFLKHL